MQVIYASAPTENNTEHIKMHIIVAT